MLGPKGHPTVVSSAGAVLEKEDRRDWDTRRLFFCQQTAYRLSSQCLSTSVSRNAELAQKGKVVHTVGYKGDGVIRRGGSRQQP